MKSGVNRLVADGFVSVAGAADFLALSVSRVYELVHGGVLSHAVLGGKIVIPWRALFDYAGQRVKQGSIA